jgi:HPt (histidine-containing phosphotransfer) domain-containing protein
MCNMTTQDDLLYSSLGADPDLGELVDVFVGEIPERVSRMQDCMDAGDSEGLGRAAHQLKGAAGSYGFQQLTPTLQRLETLARAGGEIADKRKALDEVIELCGRVRAGVPG